MRNFGGLLLLAGVLGFLFASSRLSGLDPVPAGTSISDYVRYEAGKWELARYAGGVASLVGLLLAVFPKGR
jgi:hypothetical protein